MKLLFLNTNIGYGGASKMIVWVANKCADNGFEVSFITFRDGEERQQLNPKITHIHKQLEDPNGGGSIIYSTTWLHQLIRKEHFDVGIAFLSPSILRLAIAAKGTNIKLIFSQRGDPFYTRGTNSLKSKAIDLIDFWAFSQANYYVFQTPMAKGYYSNSIQGRSIVIPNPISSMYRTIEREGNVTSSFVSVGRLDLKQKRQDILIEAFNIVCSKYPDIKLEIYGDGEDENKIRQLAESNHNIILKGKTNDVITATQNALAVLLSSDFEGIPNVLLESMSLGVPCISTDCSPGGAAMLIRNKENGILTPRGDVLALADAMEFVINHPKESELMGKKGMEVTTLFDEKTIAKNWLTLVKNISYLQQK